MTVCWLWMWHHLDALRLQHAATYCNTFGIIFDALLLQYSAILCNTLQHTATHCNTLQRTATHCNTLQHTAPHCNEHNRANLWFFCCFAQVPALGITFDEPGTLRCVAVCCGLLRCVAVRVAVAFHLMSQVCRLWACVKVWCSVLQCVAVCCSVLQYAAVCCSVCCSGVTPIQRARYVRFEHVSRWVAVCCSVMQRVAAWVAGWLSRILCLFTFSRQWGDFSSTCRRKQSSVHTGTNFKMSTRYLICSILSQLYTEKSVLYERNFSSKVSFTVNLHGKLSSEPTFENFYCFTHRVATKSQLATQCAADFF